MEVVIEIPPWLASVWEVVSSPSDVYHRALEEYGPKLWKFIFYQKNPLIILLGLVIFWPFVVYIVVGVTTASTWVFWLLASLILSSLQVVYSIYHFIMIFLDIMVLTLLKTYQVVMRSWFIQTSLFFSKRIRLARFQTSRRHKWRDALDRAHSYADYLRITILDPISDAPKSPTKARSPTRSRSFATLQTLYEENEEEEKAKSPANSPARKTLMRRLSSFDKRQMVNENDEIPPEIIKDLGNMTAEVLLSTTKRLKEARLVFDGDEESSLTFFLSGIVKRNHLTLEDKISNNARAVAHNGQHEFSGETRKAISNYYDEVCKGLSLLAEAPVMTPNRVAEMKERVRLVRKMKQNVGRTALMLSGGGAHAMYHLGTVRALYEANLYDNIQVISGTSGGSIAAACCAMYTGKELYETICVNTVSTDFRLTGEMARENIRWFPRVVDMGAYWLKNRLLVDSKYFLRTCEFYYGTTTFEEAFEKTGKHVCITVSASRATGDTVQRLLLNHISTPHVTLASAVAASCALPGVMKPTKLQAKNRQGEVEPFEVDGVEWIDGSVQADIPFERISTLFNVSNYVVCQTNFHVMPFLDQTYHPKNGKNMYRQLFQTVEWDIRNRCLKLSKLGLFPRLFGQDVSKVFKQKYHGNLTLVPRFTTAQTFGLKALVNPTVQEMEGYLKYGQQAAWPYLAVIRDMIGLEKALDDCLERLKTRFDADEFDGDDLDSIASGSLGPTGATMNNRLVRFSAQEHQVEKLQAELSRMERENMALRVQVSALRGEEDENPEEKKVDAMDVASD